MKAMIFAAGIGSRLKPFTEYHPKALVPVGGVPMLERVIVKLKKAGVSHMVVNVHHFSPQIIEFLQSKDYFGCDISISDESGRLLDTGGGLLNARQWLDSDDEPIILHNADILTDFEIRHMMRWHQSSDSDITLLVDHRSSSRMLYFDDFGKLHGWRNLNTGEAQPSEQHITADLTPMAFGGVHILNPSVFVALAEYSIVSGPVFSIMPFYLSNLQRLNIYGYLPNQPFCWFDVGSASKLADAELFITGAHIGE